MLIQTFTMISDTLIHQYVKDALQWESSLLNAQVRVMVIDGIVTLSGEVSSYAQKCIAVRTTRNVRGVRDVEEMICVVIPPEDHLTDTEIVSSVTQMLKWNVLVPDERISVMAENGMVKLEGELDWEHERQAAISTIRNMRGVKVVFNAITLSHRPQLKGIKEQVMKAFAHNACIHAENIDVTVSGNKIMLTGSVRSQTEKDEAERIAWQAPGITFADNRLQVTDPQ